MTIDFEACNHGGEERPTRVGVAVEIAGDGIKRCNRKKYGCPNFTLESGGDDRVVGEAIDGQVKCERAASLRLGPRFLSEQRYLTFASWCGATLPAEQVRFYLWPNHCVRVLEHFIAAR